MCNNHPPTHPAAVTSLSLLQQLLTCALTTRLVRDLSMPMVPLLSRL